MWNPGEWISVRESCFWSYSPGLASGITILVKRLKVMFLLASVILSTRGGLCPGGQRPISRQRPPRTVKSGRYASYWNAFLFTCCKESPGRYLPACLIAHTGTRSVTSPLAARSIKSFFKGGKGWNQKFTILNISTSWISQLPCMVFQTMDARLPCFSRLKISWPEKTNLFPDAWQTWTCE